MNRLEGRMHAAVVVALGVLLGATILTGLMQAAVQRDHWCDGQPCHPTVVSAGRDLPAPSAPGLPLHDLCLEKHVCGGGAALSLTLTLQLAAAGLRRATVAPARAWTAVRAAWPRPLHGRLLLTGVDRPPQAPA